MVGRKHRNIQDKLAFRYLKTRDRIMMDDEIIICRCEDVTWGDVRKVMEKGWGCMEEIKRVTRAGMGRCQGLTCRDMLIKTIAKTCERRVEDLFPIPTFRPPTKPLPLGVIADGEDD
jgi:NAD(P)H-nitrite reductase large subunit